MSQKTVINVSSKEKEQRGLTHVFIESFKPLADWTSSLQPSAGLVVGGTEGTAYITKSLRVPQIYSKAFMFEDGNQADGRVLTSAADGVARWATKLFDTNDVPEVITGPTDNHIHTFHNIGIGVTNPTEIFHIETETAGTGARIGNLKLGVWSGSNDYAYLIHNDLKLENSSYMLKGNKTGEVQLNSKNTLSLKINDSDAVTILKHTGTDQMRVGIGTSDPSMQLHVKNDVRIGGNLYVDGATVLVQSEVVTIADALVRFGANNPSNTKDLGFYGQYVDLGVTKFSGLFINHADNNKFHLFRDLTAEPNTTGTIDTSNANGYDLADLKLGYLYCDDGFVIMGDDSRIKFGPNGHLRFTTDNGYDKIFFTKEGKVGIGITNPQADLHLYSGSTLSVDRYIGLGVTQCDVSLDTNYTDAYRVPVGIVNQRPTKKDGLLRYNSELLQFEGVVNNKWQALGGLIDSDRDTYIKVERLPTHVDEDKIWFYTDGVARGVWNNNGNFGINATDPSIILECNSTDGVLVPVGNIAQRPTGRQGIIRYNSELQRFEGWGVGNAWGSLGGVVDIDQDTYITAERLGNLDEDHLWFYTQGVHRMIVHKNGNVGIGVTTPDFPLTVFSDTDSKAKIGRSHVGYVGFTDYSGFAHIDCATGTDFALAQGAGGDTWINCYSTQDIKFCNGGTQVACIYNGNMGINNTNPQVKLDVTGDIQVSNYVWTDKLQSRTGTSGLITAECNMTVTGNFTVNGTQTYVNTSTVWVKDPLIFLAEGNSADTVDIGFFGMYKGDGEAFTRYTGLYRDASEVDKRYKLFHGQTYHQNDWHNVVDVGVTSGFAKSILELSTVDIDEVHFPDNLYFRNSKNASTNQKKTRMTLASATGHVGIGITYPSYRLDVDAENTTSWTARIVNGDGKLLAIKNNGYGLSVQTSASTKILGTDTQYALRVISNFTNSGYSTKELFRVRNDGWVGINTSAPAYGSGTNQRTQFEVDGMGKGFGARIHSAWIGSYINAADDAGYNDCIFMHNNFSHETAGSADSKSYAVKQNTAGFTYINSKAGKGIDFEIGGQRRGGIDSVGYWGIGPGITAPQQLLHVGGTAFFEGDVRIQGNIIYTGSAANELKIQDTLIMLASENTTDAFDIGIFGKYYKDSANRWTGIYRHAADSKWRLFDNLLSDPGAGNIVDHATMGYSYAEFLVGTLRTQGGDITTTTGKIGIGLDNPTVDMETTGTDAWKLPVGTTAQRPTATTNAHRGFIRFNSELNCFEGFGAGPAWGTLGGVMDIDQDTYVNAEDSPGSDNDDLKFFTAGTQRMVIRNTGLVGINTPNPTQALDVYGNVRCISYITTSDKRVKTDIKPLSSSQCLQNICNIPVYEYRFNEVYRNACGLKDTIHFGPLAQEVEKEIPDAVNSSFNRFLDEKTGKLETIADFKSIDNNAMIAQLIGSVKALTNAYANMEKKYKAEIDELKERITRLEQC